MPMSNTGRRRRSTKSVAPSRTTSPSPSGRREPQPSRLLPQWKFSQVLGELPPAAEAHRDGAPCPQDDDGIYQSINVCILKHQS
jgi:serine/threonine-protein phosphatase 2A regulatory subunit B